MRVRGVGWHRVFSRLTALRTLTELASTREYRDWRLFRGRRNPGRRRGSLRCCRIARKREPGRDETATSKDRPESYCAALVFSEIPPWLRCLVLTSGKLARGHTCLKDIPCHRSERAAKARWRSSRCHRSAPRRLARW